MSNKKDGLRQSLSTLGQAGLGNAAGNSRANQNVDGSTSRKDACHFYVGKVVTPTEAVSAENDEVIRAVAVNFPVGLEARLQFVLGPNSGREFSDVVHGGHAVVLDHENTVVELNHSGRYRFLILDWENHPDAGISIIRQQRTQTDRLPVGALVWESTNEFQCRDDGLWEQEQNQHGHNRWVKIDDTCRWQSGNELECRDDGLYQLEINAAGDRRWVKIDATCRWQSGNELECRTDGLYQLETNAAGDQRWTKIADDCGWESDGNAYRECRPDRFVYQRETNAAGDTRWVQTAERCYDPTYPLPCGGWAFGPGDERDPAATVELTDCEDGTGQGIWVYPTAGKGHTVPVGDCHDACYTPENTVGYGANKTQTGAPRSCNC